MLVELHGGQFANKGAHKMLLTTIKELRQRLPRIRFVADGCVGSTAQLAEIDVEPILFERQWMGRRFFVPRLKAQIVLGRAAHAVPKLNFGRVPMPDVDALVDLAGFAYSDQWGEKPTRDFSLLAQFYHRSGKPVVLLPQALGPFRKGDMSESFHRIGQAASVIYARDRHSLELSRIVTSPSADIRLCPDITFPEGATFHDAAPDRPVLIVPNVRVIDHGSLDEESYLRALQEVVSTSRAPVRILVHDETGNDLTIARKLHARLASPIDLVSESDPWKIKKMISESALLVGSRYHALVAALSCGVPCLAVGWSHKYEELLSDFGSKEHLFTLQDDAASFAPKALELSNLEINQSWRNRLRAVASEMCQTVGVMWDEVADRLDKRV